MVAADDGPGPDLLGRVREVCRLYWARQGHADADVRESEKLCGERMLSYLHVSYVQDNFTEHALVGVHSDRVDVGTLTDFVELFAKHTEVRSTPEVIYTGGAPDPDVVALADEARVRLNSFERYQRSLWNYGAYVADQTERLGRDPDYPLGHHVDKRWAPLGEAPDGSTAANQILRWLDTDGARFVLVLGDFGTGKTFLVHVLAQRLAQREDIAPVLVTMRDLEKGHKLDELLAQHMARHRPNDPFHASSFRYLLREGRIILLFDGFDELAQRPTYDRVKQHFEMLRQSVDRSAKIVITSRHQHFATDDDMLTALGHEARNVDGARIIRLFPLDSGQQRDLVEQAFNQAEADKFLQDLEAVPNLPALAANPRMLTFIMARRDILADLVGADQRTEPLTAGRLYETVLTDWLKHEVDRRTTPGAAEPLTVDQCSAALRQLAILLWRTGRAGVPLAELGHVADEIADLAAWQGNPGEAAHALGSGTVLVRSADDEFAFIHRSVMEWFIADALRSRIEEHDVSVLDTALADHELTALTADFLIDLAGATAPVTWARRVASRPDGLGAAGKANAVLLLGRAERRRAAAVDAVVPAANYASQDLRGMDLSRQDLTNADLTGARLDGAILPTALAGAILRHASLRHARLDDANLTGADLYGADLRGARLPRADLTGTILHGTRLDRAILLGATIDDGALDTAASTWGAALSDSVPAIQFGGRSAVRAMAALGADFLVTGHRDGTVRLWDIEPGLLVRTIEAQEGPVGALAVDPAGRWVASGGEDGAVRLWNPVTGALIRTLPVSGRALALAVDPNGRWLASGGEDGAVVLWDPATGKRLRTLSVTGRVLALAVAPDGEWLVSASEDGAVRLYRRDGTLMLAKEGRPLGVRALAVDPDGRWWASVSDDGEIRRWEPETGRPLAHAVGSDVRRATALAVAPNGAWLAVAGADGDVVTHDLSNDEVLSGWQDIDEVAVLAAGPRGDWVAWAGDGGVIRVCDPTVDAVPRTLSDRAHAIRALAVDRAGRWLASTGDDGAMRIWDTVGGGLSTVGGRHSAGKHALVADPNGEWIAAADVGGQVSVWDVESGVNRFTERANVWWGHGLVVGPGGWWLAWAREDGVVQLHDPATNLPLYTLESETRSAKVLAVHPGGAWLASGDAGMVRLWDPGTAALIRTLDGHARDVRAIAVDPGGEWIAVADDGGGVRLWDPATGAQLRNLAGDSLQVRALAVDPGGAWLAVANDEGVIRLWDPATGALIRTLAGRSREIRAMAVHPAGEWLAGAGDDGVVRLWDPATGTALRALVADENGCAEFTPAGHHVVGSPAGAWWAAGLCRFELGEIEQAPANLTQPSHRHGSTDDEH